MAIQIFPKHICHSEAFPVNCEQHRMSHKSPKKQSSIHSLVVFIFCSYCSIASRTISTETNICTTIRYSLGPVWYFFGWIAQSYWKIISECNCKQFSVSNVCVSLAEACNNNDDDDDNRNKDRGMNELDCPSPVYCVLVVVVGDSAVVVAGGGGGNF